MSGYVINQRWQPLTGVDRKLRVSQLVYMIAAKFQRLHPCFQGQAIQMNCWEPMYGHVVNQRWWPCTGSNNVNITDP